MCVTVLLREPYFLEMGRKEREKEREERICVVGG